MRLQSSKLDNSNLIKDRSNYIRFIYHLYRDNEKNVTYVTLRAAYLFSKVHICDAKIAHLDDIADLEILPYGLHFSEVKSIAKIIKDVDG